MKLLLLGVLSLAPGLVLACANKVDPNKVMFFIDTNNSALEIATTQKAACARGERLVVIPKNHKEFDRYIKASEDANKTLIKLNCQNSNSSACKLATEKAYEASTNLWKFKEAQPPYKDEIKKELEELRKSNAKLVNFSISGHDGGGHFSGFKGDITRQELAEALQEFGDVNEVQSLLLLGCYTGTQHEVIEWKNIFPDTRLIAGYDGSAPLADRPQGHQYISDILNREKSLVNLADAKRLQAYLNANLKGLNHLSAAMYFQCEEDGNAQEYYYGSKQSRQVKPFDTKECLEKKAELHESSRLVQKYFSGELEPPKNTQSGELRNLYNFVRANEHCLSLTDAYIDTNALFNLLFHEGVEQSFAHFYKDDLKEVEAYLNLNPDEMEKQLEGLLAQQEEAAKQQDALAEQIKNSPEEYLAQKEAELARSQEELNQALNDPQYASVKNMVNLENGMIQYNSVTTEQIKKLNQLSDLVVKHLWKKWELDEDKKDLHGAIDKRKNNAQVLRDNIQGMRTNFLKIKEDLADPQKKIWVPNAENLKKHTRKELLDNIHRMNSLLFTPVLNNEQNKAIRWLTQSASMHLQFFQNPFSWHEFTGNVEAPAFHQRFKDFMKNDSAYGGYMGGGYIGGGAIGGSGSGEAWTPI